MLSGNNAIFLKAAGTSSVACMITLEYEEYSNDKQ